MQQGTLFALNVSYSQQVLPMNRRTFIKGSIGLSVIGITGCATTSVKNKSKNKAIKEINIDSHSGWGDKYVRVTVVFYEREVGNLKLIAYDEDEIMQSKKINVNDEEVVTHKFSDYYTDIDVMFSKV